MQSNSPYSPGPSSFNATPGSPPSPQVSIGLAGRKDSIEFLEQPVSEGKQKSGSGLPKICTAICAFFWGIVRLLTCGKLGKAKEADALKTKTLEWKDSLLSDPAQLKSAVIQASQTLCNNFPAELDGEILKGEGRPHMQLQFSCKWLGAKEGDLESLASYGTVNKVDQDMYREVLKQAVEGFGQHLDTVMAEDKFKEKTASAHFDPSLLALRVEVSISLSLYRPNKQPVLNSDYSRSEDLSLWKKT